MMAAARMAFASSCRVHLLLPSSPSTPILARPRVGFRGIAKSISFLAPLSAARSAALFCSCSSPSSDAVVAPVPTQADTLYVEEVDVGEEQPRTICSGLVKYLPLDQLQDSNVIVLANLKPRNMRGIKSSGMLMCASDASHETVELLTPPEGSVPGERVWFGSEDEKSIQSEPATGNQVQKKKIWESVQPHLKTTDNCVAVLGEQPMRTSAGMVFCKSLQGASVS
ncbi:hypothetical protein CFC21_023493 [Triticum aestivum]|uniref:tRNA-binding domain-containing protein n=2 Tax=Triticum aestivum TaxID=4565 RepID=A0A9R1EEW8_WHEAT|nr:hypothetical protein CFC21_023493 [Triticum aestivum]